MNTDEHRRRNRRPYPCSSVFICGSNSNFPNSPWLRPEPALDLRGDQPGFVQILSTETDAASEIGDRFGVLTPDLFARENQVNPSPGGRLRRPGNSFAPRDDFAVGQTIVSCGLPCARLLTWSRRFRLHPTLSLCLFAACRDTE